MEYFNIMFKPTGNVFKLTKKRALELVTQDGNFNYKILDKGYETKPKQEIKTSTYNKVVVEETVTEQVTNTETDTEAELENKSDFEKYNTMTVPQLRTYMTENNIEFTKSDRKDDLINKIIETEKEKA